MIVFPDTEPDSPDEIKNKIFSTNPYDIINTLLTNKDGDIVLPVTIANNVFDKNGIDLQTKLDSITRIGFASTFITVNNADYQFDFEYPFLFMTYFNIIIL